MANQAAHPLWVALRNKSTQCSFTVWGSGIEQQAGHWCSAWCTGVTVHTFSDARRAVSRFERQLTHQSVREGMHQRVPDAWVALGRGRHCPGGFPSSVRRPQACISSSHLLFPCQKNIALEVEEDSFASHL